MYVYIICIKRKKITVNVTKMNPALKKKHTQDIA